MLKAASSRCILTIRHPMGSFGGTRCKAGSPLAINLISLKYSLVHHLLLPIISNHLKLYIRRNLSSVCPFLRIRSHRSFSMTRSELYNCTTLKFLLKWWVLLYCLCSVKLKHCQLSCIASCFWSALPRWVSSRWMKVLLGVVH